MKINKMKQNNQFINKLVNRFFNVKVNKQLKIMNGTKRNFNFKQS